MSKNQNNIISQLLRNKAIYMSILAGLAFQGYQAQAQEAQSSSTSVLQQDNAKVASDVKKVKKLRHKAKAEDGVAKEKTVEKIKVEKRKLKSDLKKRRADKKAAESSSAVSSEAPASSAPANK